MADEAVALQVISRKAAIAAGLKHFFSGRPCRNGHLTPRPVSGSGCPICSDIRVRAWNAANVERRKRIRDKWRTENRERDLQTKRDYTARNREKLAAKGKEYYRANKEQHQASMRAWKETHRDEMVWMSQRSRAKKFGCAGPVITLAQIARLRAEQAGKCVYCHEDRPLVFDHVHPVIYGGSFGADNTVMACRSCNGSKAYHPLAFFLERLAGKRQGQWTATVTHIEMLLAEPWRREQKRPAAP